MPKDCGRGSLRGEDSRQLEKFHVAATFLSVSSDLRPSVGVVLKVGDNMGCAIGQESPSGMRNSQANFTVTQADIQEEASWAFKL